MGRFLLLVGLIEPFGSIRGMGRFLLLVGLIEPFGSMRGMGRFLLLVGFSDLSPLYKGYDLFWDALPALPPDFRRDLAVLIVGGPPSHYSGMEVCLARARDGEGLGWPREGEG
jgi:hypothetical protein